MNSALESRYETNRQGFSLVEVMVALALILISALALGWSINELRKNKIRSELISGVSAIESALTNELMDEANYADPAVKSALRAMTVPPGLEFRVQGTAVNRPFDFRISPGGTRNFDRRLNDCTTYPSPDCNIQLELELAPQGGRMAYAYRLTTQNEEIARTLQYQGMGSQTNSATFNSSEFKVTIPYEYYLNALLLMCDSTNATVGIRGVNRDFGTVSCIQQPQTPCPQGTLPKGLRFEASTASVEFDCGAPAQTATCPSNYSLLQLDTRSLDPAATKSGTCVYTHARFASGPSYGPADSISGRVCPANYRSQSTCTLTNITQTNGWCPAQYTCTPNPSPLPPTCVLTTPAYVQTPTPGSASLSEDAFGNATCSVFRPSQSCGAQWDAQVNMTVGCVLAVPETVPVQ